MKIKTIRNKNLSKLLYYLPKTEEVETYLERVRQLDEAAEQEQRQNPSPFIVELWERLAKASEKLRDGKRKPTKLVDTL